MFYFQLYFDLHMMWYCFNEHLSWFDPMFYWTFCVKLVILQQLIKFWHHDSTPYWPKMNGAVEAANKNIKKIIQKMIVTYRDWHKVPSYALHDYQNFVCTSIGATLFSLVYRMEAVLLFEVEIPSLRVLSEAEMEEVEWAHACCHTLISSGYYCLMACNL